MFEYVLQKWLLRCLHSVHADGFVFFCILLCFAFFFLLHLHVFCIYCPSILQFRLFRNIYSFVGLCLEFCICVCSLAGSALRQIKKKSPALIRSSGDKTSMNRFLSCGRERRTRGGRGMLVGVTTNATNWSCDGLRGATGREALGRP